jgi:single-stranded-DNA-specific exonuclease
VPLDHNNRVLVAAGLRRIRAGRAVPGVRALLAVAGRDEARCSATDLGFAVAPRINAAGRLEDMGLGIACLLSGDPDEARVLAGRLDAINAERRQRQGEMSATADALAEAWLARHGRLPAGLCLLDPDWHPGIVGLVATRLRERLERPVLAFAPAVPGGGELRGSGRSIAGFHLRDALALIDVRHPGLVERFGGHAMAAGLTLPAAGFERFSQAFEAVAAECLGSAAGAAVLESDGSLAGEQVDLALAEQLQDGGPWGQGFPEPCFDDEFELASARPVGNGHWQFGLRWPAGGATLPAVHFGGAAAGAPTPRMRVVYQLMVDEWRGARQLKLKVLHREPA